MIKIDEEFESVNEWKLLVTDIYVQKNLLSEKYETVIVFVATRGVEKMAATELTLKRFLSVLKD